MFLSHLITLVLINPNGNTSKSPFLSLILINFSSRYNLTTQRALMPALRTNERTRTAFHLYFSLTQQTDLGEL